MISFLDKTFCSSPNCKDACGRQWTPELQARANEWWKGFNMPTEDPSVAFSDFCKDEE